MYFVVLDLWGQNDDAIMMNVKHFLFIVLGLRTFFPLDHHHLVGDVLTHSLLSWEIVGIFIFSGGLFGVPFHV